MDEEYANVKFDFRIGSNFREWSPSDNLYTAEIRISFDQPGYWSTVGRDSVDLKQIF